MDGDGMRTLVLVDPGGRQQADRRTAAGTGGTHGAPLHLGHWMAAPGPTATWPN